MALYKNVSVKRIIAKVLTDNNMQESADHRISDMINYAGEAAEKIGAFSQFINRVTGKNDLPLVEFDNYQAVLPHDFHRLIQISYAPSSDGPYYALRQATGSFERTGGETTDTSTDIDIVAASSSVVTLAMSIFDYTYAQALSAINSDPALKSLLSGLLSSNNASQPGSALSNTADYVYTITDNFIKLNVEQGYLMIAYQAIPTDGEGYPLLPDSVSYLEAVYYYITMKLMYPDWVAGRIRDAVYYDARRSWNYHCKQAYADAIMPNADQMESIKNSWLRLIPNINQHSEFYSTVGEQEIIHNAHA